MIEEEGTAARCTDDYWQARAEQAEHDAAEHLARRLEAEAENVELRSMIHRLRAVVRAVTAAVADPSLLSELDAAVAAAS